MKVETILVCVVMLLILLSMSKAAAQPPSPPCVFYGYVSVGGKPARDGLNVTVVISGTTLNWTTQTGDGTYGWPVKGSGSFEIPTQDPNATGRDGGVAGDVIQFYLQGIKTSQTAIFESAGIYEVDLSVSYMPEETFLTVSLNCSTAYAGYNVNMSGELAYGNGTCIPQAELSLTYSATGGTSWNNIASVNTTTDGNYHAEWTPTPTGNYVVKVNWEGNPTLKAWAAEANASLAATQTEEKYVFSVISNSTISGLVFSSSDKVLTFNLSGPSGTTGYTNITIPKDLIEEITAVKVQLDGNQINYTAVSSDTSWLLNFAYQHSTHTVTVSLSSPANSNSSNLYPMYAAVIVIAIIICIVAVFWTQRKRNSTKVEKRKSSK
jgi:hypothetical protein